MVHTLADDVAKGTSPAEIEPLMVLLDRVWDALGLRGALAVRPAAHRGPQGPGAVPRLAHRATVAGPSSRPSTRSPSSLVVGDREVVLRGSMDRVEVDRDGLVHVIDLKTGKNPPSGPKVAEHPQLGVYQVAVREGAVADLRGWPAP